MSQRYTPEFVPDPIFGDLRAAHAYMPTLGAPVALPTGSFPTQRRAYARSTSSLSSGSSSQSQSPRTPADSPRTVGDRYVYHEYAKSRTVPHARAVASGPHAPHTTPNAYSTSPGYHRRASSSGSSSSSHGVYLSAPHAVEKSSLFATEFAAPDPHLLSPMPILPAPLTPPAYGQPVAPSGYPSGYTASVPHSSAYPLGSPYHPRASTPAVVSRASHGALASAHPSGSAPTYVAYQPQYRDSARAASTSQDGTSASPSPRGESRLVPLTRYEARHSGMRDRIAVREGATKVIYFGKDGVRIKDALAGKMSGMDGKNDRVMKDVTAKTSSVRIHWPGLQTAHRGDLDCAGDLTREVLAFRVAKCVVRFFEAVQEKGLAKWDPANKDLMEWWIGTGPGAIRPEDLVIVRLERVSHGSWQPVLRLLTSA